MSFGVIKSQTRNLNLKDHKELLIFVYVINYQRSATPSAEQVYISQVSFLEDIVQISFLRLPNSEYHHIMRSSHLWFASK